MKIKDNSLLKTLAFVNGDWIGADSGVVHVIVNPSTGLEIATVPDLGTIETLRAIDGAERALPAWRAMSAKERAALLRKWYDLIVANQDDLAVILTSEQGKPLEEARSEVLYGASFIEWFAEEGKRAYGEVIPPPSGDKRLVVVKQPVGVTAAITPWNFPIAMITRKAGPALAAGCTMVVKPAEATPLSALALAELASRAGIPPGVLNIVTTSRPAVVGDVLTASPIIRKLSFTGSTAVGKRLMSQCSGTVKRISLELGGNAPFIVFDDCDIDAAVRGAVVSKFRNAGQTCVCSNRIFVQDEIYDAFAEKLVAAVAAMKVGDGLEPSSQIGPLINSAAASKVDRLVRNAVEKGAELALGGRYLSEGSNFYMPTILTEVSPMMEVAQEEIFGPVAPLIRFKTDADVVRMANESSAGLASYIYTRDIKRLWLVAEQLEYGMVGINEGAISNEVAPFGGVKESGIGREGSHHGIDEYLQLKYLCLGGMV